MYGGKGTLPRLKRAASSEKLMSFMPSGPSPLTSASTLILSPIEVSFVISILSPVSMRLPGFTSASQVLLPEWRSSNISTLPPVSTFLP